MSSKQTIEVQGPRALRAREVIAKLAISRGTLFNLIRKNKFPKPFRASPSGKSTRWLASDVDAYLKRISQKRSFGG